MKGLNKQVLNQIINLIINYRTPEKIVIFGSRAKGDYKHTSDIDIAILGKDWTGRDINVIKHTLDEYVKTPLKFDVLNFYTITKDKLKENILRKGRVVYEFREN